MNPLEPLRIVRVNTTCPDPAIAQDACTVEQARAYLDTRDVSVLPLREGARPTLFVVRRLPAAYLIDVLEPLQQTERQHLAFRAACHTVEGEEPLSVVSAEGPTKGARFVASPESRGVSLAPPEWVQEIVDRYGSDTVREIGQAACDHARLPFVRRGGFRWWGG